MFAAKNELFTRPSGGYQISRSVRLRSSATAYFNRTFAGTPNTWTWSSWIKRGTLGTSQAITASRFVSGLSAGIFFNSNDTLGVNLNAATAFTSTSVYRDPSAWYHIVVSVTQSGASYLYVNGNQVGTWTSGATSFLYTSSAGYVNAIGRNGDASTNYLDGYLTEINFIDGQALTPSSFGEFNAITGVWQPKAYTGTYGTNGFELNFSDNSTAAALGTDFSGNSNTWTVNNISVTAGVTYDSMIDVPTNYADGNTGRGNYAVLNPLDAPGTAPSGANMQLTTSTTWNSAKLSLYVVPGSKTYIECKPSVNTGANEAITMGVGNALGTLTGNAAYSGTGIWSVAISSSQQTYTNSGSNVNNTLKTSCLATDVMCMAIDATNYPTTTYMWIGFASGSTVTWYYNTNQSGGDPTLGASGNPTFTISGANNLYAFAGGYNITNYVNAGQRPWQATPPTGFLALNTQNLPTPTISNGAAYMAATLYTGTGSSLTVSNAVNGISFKPDWVWVKRRDGPQSHQLYDINRGVNQAVYSNLTSAEVTEANGLSAFTSSGFTVISDIGVNTSGGTYVGWNWKASNTTASNTNGSITSTVSAGATQGFSVVTYTGNGSTGTVGHGLGVAPSMMIFKQRSAVRDWIVYHITLGAGNRVFLNLTNASGASTANFNNTAPTSSVFSIGATTATNESSGTYVAYCFAPVAGYSAFGSYTGNGSADGPFVFLGFRPRWVMIKKSSAVDDWVIFDSARDTFTVVNDWLFAQSSSAELTTAGSPDILSNGFKLRSTSGATNASGATFIYMAFAENPFKLSLAR
jgi:hypothetical protein